MRSDRESVTMKKPKRTPAEIAAERKFNEEYKGRLIDHPYFAPNAPLKPYIVEKFFQFHSDNPKVYELFVGFANQLYGSGRANYGSHAIVERIRWHTNIETSTTEKDFKISNNHQVCYCRLLMINDPKFVGFFRIQGIWPFWQQGEHNGREN